MIKLSKSAKIKRAYFDHKKSAIRSLYGAYKKPSFDKKCVWDKCEEIASKYNGYNLKIISFNTYHFTCGFLYDDCDRYGNVLDTYFVYITPSQILKISVNETV